MDVQPLGGVLRHLEAVPDPRRFDVAYTLTQLLTCTLMAVLRRCDDYEEIAGRGAVCRGWLVEVLGLPADHTPCRETGAPRRRRGAGGGHAASPRVRAGPAGGGAWRGASHASTRRWATTCRGMSRMARRTRR